MGPGQLAAVEGKSICIGSGCLFSYDIEIRTSDSHSIIDKTTSERLNYAQDVVIGDNVWVCAHARILKGAYVAAHSIIGNSSIVGSSCKDPYSIYAGIPAKKIKENINWITHRIS
jgi:acetyltransferase-like isoleucine patch superfamily enzyme